MGKGSPQDWRSIPVWSRVSIYLGLHNSTLMQPSNICQRNHFRTHILVENPFISTTHLRMGFKLGVYDFRFLFSECSGCSLLPNDRCSSWSPRIWACTPFLLRSFLFLHLWFCTWSDVPMYLLHVGSLSATDVWSQRILCLEAVFGHCCLMEITQFLALYPWAACFISHLW